MPKKPIETIGDNLLELEIVLDKIYDHGLQLGDVLGIVMVHTQVHRPDAIEVFTEDKSSPVLKYMHKDKI